MPRPLRVATRGSALARWQADRVATLLGDDAELVIVTTSGDVADRRAHPRDGRDRRLREGGAAGRARRPRRRRRALGQGPPRLARPGGHRARRRPRAGRSPRRARRLDPRRPARRRARRHRVGAAPRAARRPATRSHVRRAARQHPHPARPRRRVRRHRGGGGRARAPRPCGRGRRVPGAVGHAAPGRARVRSRSSAAPTTPRPASGSHAIDDTRAHAAVGAERAFLAELGGGCDLPCGAYATLDGTAVVIEALLAAPDGHVVLRASARDASPVTAGRASPPSCWSAAAAPSSTVTAGVRRRARRERRRERATPWRGVELERRYRVRASDPARRGDGVRDRLPGRRRAR